MFRNLLISLFGGKMKQVTIKHASKCFFFCLLGWNFYIKFTVRKDSTGKKVSKRSAWTVSILQCAVQAGLFLLKNLLQTACPNSVHALFSWGHQYLSFKCAPSFLSAFPFLHLLCLSVCALFTQLLVPALCTAQRIRTISHRRPPEEPLLS